jgi:hypothetical protein
LEIEAGIKGGDSMKIIKLLLILLLCATLYISYGCEDNAIEPSKQGEQSDGPGDEDEVT